MEVRDRRQRLHCAAGCAADRRTMAVAHAKGAACAVGLLHTCAMLFHVLAAIFLVPAVVGLYVQRRGDRRAAMRVISVYLATVLLLSSGAYYTCFQIATGQTDLAAFVRWVTYHTPDSDFSFDAVHNAWLTIRGTARLLVGGRVSNFDSGRIVDLGVLVGLSAFGMVFVRRAGPARSREPYHKLLPLFCSWVMAYAAFLFFWLPQNTFYSCSTCRPSCCWRASSRGSGPVERRCTPLWHWPACGTMPSSSFPTPK